jgi:hypothetical protein
MTPVALEPELVAQLTANGGKVPLVDRDGNPVGYFLSPSQFALMEQALNDWMYREPTAEDVRKSLADPRRHSTEDVLKLLEE